MLEQSPPRLVSLKKLDPVPVWVEIDPVNVARSVHLVADPGIAIVIFSDGCVMPVTADSARNARLI